MTKQGDSGTSIAGRRMVAFWRSVTSAVRYYCRWCLSRRGLKREGRLAVANDMPIEAPPAPDYGRAEAKAREVLRENFVTEPPVPIEQLVTNYDLQAVEADFSPKYSNVAGFINLENKQVVLNRSDAGTRQAFTLAHELGHWLLHPQLRDQPETLIVLRQPLGRTGGDPLEREANCFAANLLVPRDFLIQYITYPVSTIAKAFGVSPDVIEFRLANTGLRHG